MNKGRKKGTESNVWLSIACIDCKCIVNLNVAELMMRNNFFTRMTLNVNVVAHKRCHSKPNTVLI